MHDPEEHVARLVVFLFDILFYHIREWSVSCFVTLHDFATAFIDHNDMIVFVEDAHYTIL